MGHLPGAKKSDFLFRGAKADEPQGSRAGLILLIPAGEVSLGSPRVGTIHVQAPTSHTPVLGALEGSGSHCQAIHGFVARTDERIGRNLLEAAAYAV